MKKMFWVVGISVITLCSCICTRTFAYSDDTAAKLQEFKKSQAQIKKYIPYYNNLATCTPYKSDLYKIYGKVNRGCHIYLQDTLGNGYDCHVPMTVAKANSSYGKSTFNKISTINFDKLDFNSNNAEQSMKDAEQILKDLTQAQNDLKPLMQMESTILQYHCKKL